MSNLRLLLSANHLHKSFGAHTLFTAEHLEIHDGDRIGLVAKNGGGKTTLLRILSGELLPDGGSVERHCALSLIRQPELAGDTPCISARDSANTPHTDPRLLRKLGGGAGKSGGEQTRLAIAAAISQNSPLLLADEPATNLDMSGMLLLERQLCAYRGAVVLVAHDRALLDTVCTTIWSIEDDAIRIFTGNYSAWAAQKEREATFAQLEYTQYRKERSRLQSEVSSIREEARGMRKAPRRMGNSEARLHKGSKTSQKHLQARSTAIQSRLSQLETKSAPRKQLTVQMDTAQASSIVSKTAAQIEKLSVRYGTHLVLDNASFSLPTGSKTIMLGDNGTGKSTLAAHLAQLGDCTKLAGGVKLGYFAQQHEQLDPAHTVLENARRFSSLPEAEVRTILARLDVTGDAVHKSASVLSGGERAKTAFAMLLASDCNLLIFDEPTNHIDFQTAEALESLLQQWQGTLLVVTHDRRLAAQLADRLLFVENGGVRAFEGDWEAWEASRTKIATASQQSQQLESLLDAMRRACP